MEITIYHNPKCSKSRETLQLLRERGIEPEVVEYLKTPPDESTLDRLLKLLGLEPDELLRKKEDEYQQLGLGEKKFSRDELIRAMVAHPILIERPIVVSGDRERGNRERGLRAVLGRPPEKVLELLR
ncbi:MAG: arsenate reductase (glutaredoxin) [Armatimonadetes bacterium]|nr:arsenate reductase (glutaredoxin) [Armatimonadota bacterium]